MKFYQRGSAAVGVLLAFVGIIAVAAVVAITAYIQNGNYANRMEVTIKASWENNQNVLGNYTLKIQEMASVPEMYKNDLKEVMTSVMTARMGADGSKAMMQWFKEANIPFDASLYGKLQQTIEAGRNEFTMHQTKLIDTKREYETQMGYFWTGFWIKMAGYPKINLADYKPVVAEGTREVFKNGVQAPILQRKQQ